MTIMQTAPGRYTVDNGHGTTLTLVWKSADRWEVWSDNAAVRAWRSLGIRTFRDLSEVERAYKAFRGIRQFVDASNGDALNDTVASVTTL